MMKQLGQLPDHHDNEFAALIDALQKASERLAAPAAVSKESTSIHVAVPQTAAVESQLGVESTAAAALPQQGDGVVAVHETGSDAAAVDGDARVRSEVASRVAVDFDESVTVARVLADEKGVTILPDGLQRARCRLWLLSPPTNTRRFHKLGETPAVPRAKDLVWFAVGLQDVYCCSKCCRWCVFYMVVAWLR